MSKISPIYNGIRNSVSAIAENANRQKRVAKRAAQMYNLSPNTTKALEVQGWCKGAFQTFFKKVSGLSDNVQTLINTVSTVGKNMKASTTQARNANPKASVIKAKLSGLKESLPEIKTAIKQVGGVNDVKAAYEHGGKIAGIKEAGKAAFRVGSCAGLSTLATFCPVPGAFITCWVTAEKASSLIVGKPFLKKMAQKVK